MSKPPSISAIIQRINTSGDVRDFCHAMAVIDARLNDLEGEGIIKEALTELYRANCELIELRARKTFWGWLYSKFSKKGKRS